MKTKIKLNYEDQTPKREGYWISLGEEGSLEWMKRPDAVGIILPGIEGDFFVWRNPHLGKKGKYVVSDGLTGGLIAANKTLWKAVILAQGQFSENGALKWREMADRLKPNYSPRYQKPEVKMNYQFSEN